MPTKEKGRNRGEVQLIRLATTTAIIIDIASRAWLVVVKIPAPAVIVRPGRAAIGPVEIIAALIVATIIHTGLGAPASLVSPARGIIAKGFILLTRLADAPVGIESEGGTRTSG